MMTQPQPPDDRTGLVLSGGGARGAYEVGVVEGILQVLGLGPDDPSPFQIFTGTSVGAINTAYFASMAHRGDLGIEHLIELWTSLTLLRDLEIDLSAVLGLKNKFWAQRLKPRTGRAAGPAALRAEPLDHLVRTGLDWDKLHQNIQEDHTHACAIAALQMSTGKTALFTELSPKASFIPSRDPRRFSMTTRLTADHVLASAAIPMIFPPRRIQGELYVDGGLRFNTPIAPALRCGARRLVIISVRYPGAEQGEPESPVTKGLPGMAYMMGKLLNAVLLDPIEYDLQVLHRFNVLIDVLHATTTPEERERIDRAIAEIRGQPYQSVKTLFFQPTENMGQMARRYIQEAGMQIGTGWGARLKTRGLQSLIGSGSDLGSFLLFDGGFARRIIDLGRRDALARATAIRAFFGVL